MKLSDSYDDFAVKLDRIHPRYDETLQLPFFDADSGDCGQGFRLNATMHSDRRRPPVPTKAAGVWLPA